MFVVKNAWKSVMRNKGRNILVIIIVTIIVTAATIGLSIRQAATTARNTGLENTTVTAQISLDREKLISESRNQSNSSESDASDQSGEGRPNVGGMGGGKIRRYVHGQRRFLARRLLFGRSGFQYIER